MSRMYIHDFGSRYIDFYFTTKSGRITGESVIDREDWETLKEIAVKIGWEKEEENLQITD